MHPCVDHFPCVALIFPENEGAAMPSFKLSQSCYFQDVKKEDKQVPLGLGCVSLLFQEALGILSIKAEHNVLTSLH